MIVRCFMLSFVMIKAFDSLVPSEAAQPTLSEVPSSSPMHPTSFVCGNNGPKSTQPDDCALSFESLRQDSNLTLWGFVILVSILHYAYQYCNESSRTRISNVRKPSNGGLPVILNPSFGPMVLSLICGVVLARIPIDQNAIVATCKEFSSWYFTNLEEYPLTTKCLTSSVFSCLADLIAQVIEGMLHSDKCFLENYDARRGFAFFLDGILLSGPLLHYAFDLMESFFPTEGEDGSLLSSIIHIFLNDYLVDTIYILLSFVLVAIVEGDLQDLGNILKKNFCSTLKASWCTSFSVIPVEFVCFRYLSLGHRVLGMNVIDIFWQSVVSFFAHRGRKKAHRDTGSEDLQTEAAPIISD